NAKKWAAQLTEHVKPLVAHMPPLEAFMTIPNAVQVRCRKWDDVLASPAPDEASMPITAALWHFSRGMADAAKGDVDNAAKEREAMKTITGKIPADAGFAMVNKAHTVLDIADNTLAARMAAAKKQWSQAAELLRKAAELQDGMNYIEPPDWLLSSRDSLG